MLSRHSPRLGAPVCEMADEGDQTLPRRREDGDEELQARADE